MKERLRSVSVSQNLLRLLSPWGFRKPERLRRPCSVPATSRVAWKVVAFVCRLRSKWSQIAFAFLACASLPAQTDQFLPEFYSYLTLNSKIRVYYDAKDDRDGGQSTQVTTGPSIQLLVKPLLRLKRITTFDLDDAKPRALVLEAGYRYISAPNEPTYIRFLPSVTSHFPMKYGFLITDRNRADLDWIGGVLKWRYRNKLTIERTFTIHSYHPIPYVAFEPYYTGQYGKWSTTSEFAGCLLPVGSHVQFNPYYEHENDTGKRPNKQENYIGLAVYLYFSVEKKRPAD